MRILFVAMPDSVHSARWISQIADQGWDIYLFPAYIGRLHPNFNHITAYKSFLSRKPGRNKTVRTIWWTLLFFWGDYAISKLQRTRTNVLTQKALGFVICRLKPDMVHSLEFQQAGYLTWAVREHFPGKFPTWVITNWGSDVFLFGRLAEHRAKVEAILANCDYYACECKRDIALAEKLGFKGKSLPVFPISGGMPLEKFVRLQSGVPPAARRIIFLKGYQGWAGRALVALQALRQCADLLADYTISISAADPEVRIAAELFAQDTTIPVKVISTVSHDEMLCLQGSARIYIGLSITDGISTSLLEAMAMGAFPIQSCTACADEWIEDGVSGLIVPPEDPYVIAEAIRRALTDDALVNQAAEINAQTIAQRLDYATVQTRVIAMYQDIYAACQ